MADFKIGNVVRHIDHEDVSECYRGAVGVIDSWLREDLSVWIVLFGPPQGCVSRCNSNIKHLELVSDE